MPVPSLSFLVREEACETVLVEIQVDTGEFTRVIASLDLSPAEAKRLGAKLLSLSESSFTGPTVETLLEDLEGSSWADSYPEALSALQDYQMDIEVTLAECLKEAGK